MLCFDQTGLLLTTLLLTTLLEKDELESRKGLREKLDQKRIELEQAKRSGDFDL